MSRAHPKPPYATMMAVVREVSVDTGVPVEEICAARVTRDANGARNRVWIKLFGLGWSASAIARGWGCTQPAVQPVVSPPNERLRPSPMAASIALTWPAIDAKLAERAR